MSRSVPPRIPTPCFQLRDGSVVELRERSGYSASQAGADLTIHLERGSIMSKRPIAARALSSWPPPIARAVTGTVFQRSAG